MPRVTRRSLAAKKDSSSQEEDTPTKATAKRGRNAKKDEPEATVPDEPAAKRGRSSTRGAKASLEEEVKTPRGRGRPAGKKEAPAKEENEEEVEEEQAKPAPSRGRGRSAKGRKSAPEEEEVEEPEPAAPTPSKGRGRSARGRKPATEEKSEEKEEVEEEEAPSKPTPTRGRGRPARGKKAAEDESESGSVEPSPSPRGRRGGRSAANVDTKVEESGSAPETKTSPGAPRGGRRSRGEAKTEEKVEEEKEQTIDTEPEAADKTEALMTPQKEETAESELSETKATDVSKDEKPQTKVPCEEVTQIVKENDSEPVDEKGIPEEDDGVENITAEDKELSPEPKQQESMEQSDENVSMPADEEPQAEPVETEEKMDAEVTEAVEPEPTDEDGPSPAKKRRLEDEEEEEEPSAKRVKASESSTISDAPQAPADDLADFVVIEKNDVPSVDSKEVIESIARATPSESTEPEETASSVEKETPSEPQQTFVAPSESKDASAPMAAPGVPIVVPLTEAELAKQYTTQHMMKDRDENSSTLVEVGSENASDITGASVQGLDISDVTSVDSMDTAALNQSAPAGPNISTNAIETPSKSTDQQLKQVTETSTIKEVSTSLTEIEQQVVEPSSHPSNVVTLPTQNTTHVIPTPNAAQNGTTQDVSSVPSNPMFTSTPAKGPTEKYIPSSTTIFKRKFLANPNFPVELMDPAFAFSVVSYNILADCHLRRYNYSYTALEYLDQMYRHELLMKELDYLAGDIVCMQEVNPTYYTNVLAPAMASRGFVGSIFKRTKDFFDEGEATFVRTTRFDVVEFVGLSLRDLAFKEVDAARLASDVSAAAKKYLDRADVILLTKVRCKKTGKQLTVCNIHVVFDNASPDVQCVQIACAMNAVVTSAIKELVLKAGNDLHPHIICGDFNSDPLSSAYQLAKDGYLSDTHIRNLQALERMENTDGSSRSMIHHLWRAFQHTSSNLKSAYETASGVEPKMTSYNAVTDKCLDYLMYSSSSLDVAGVLQVLDKEVAMATGGTPSKDIPSDHLSVKAVFRIK